VGNGCTLKQQVRLLDTTSMRALVVESSATGEIALTMKNLTATQFKQINRLDESSTLGGAFSFKGLAEALIQHLTCSHNQQFGAGCMAFVGGDRIFIEDSE
jgi:hypothetical protein